ncbi:MAG: LuxR family transcriptional regulator [Actinomycetota bacterium]|nr:LuxR family transcriptional regulator [Actinomycetota bacterium]MDP2287606.1 LuxR family transcriptional regulator [Actinomycetota bacterium]
MNKTSLTSLAQEHLQIARTASSGRSAHTVLGGHTHVLRQTLIALADGHNLADHDSPGEATLQVVLGNVRLVEGANVQEGVVGDLIEIPAARHRLEALEDSVVLLTIAQSID